MNPLRRKNFWLFLILATVSFAFLDLYGDRVPETVGLVVGLLCAFSVLGGFVVVLRAFFEGMSE